jgi:hypothetical protein
MRIFTALFLAFCLLVLPMVPAQSQTSSDAPRGLDPIPGYNSLYVVDAPRFMLGAFLLNMATQPRDVRAFLRGLRTCTSSRPLAIRLQNEGLRTTVVTAQETFTALSSGSCDVFIGANFDLAQLDRRLNSGGDDPRPTPPDRPTQPDDVDIDRTPPEITPLEQVFEGTGRTISVGARITDSQSDIREAYVQMSDGTRFQMTAPQGGSIYSATVNLPRDFGDQVIIFVAIDTANVPARARAGLRLLQWCGPREVVSQTLVQDVQENLACVGISAGATDGALGPNTCRAIGGYFGDRMPSFNAGRIGWATLQQELARACLAAQPVVLDVPGPIEVDTDRTNVRISLAQPGLTEFIRIAGADGVGTQTLTWRGEPLIFDMQMPPPGQDVAYRVQALGPEGDALDTATLRLIRPPVLMSVQPSGPVVASEPLTEFAVLVTRGASAVTLIEVRQPNANPVSQRYEGGTATLSLQSPEPGTSQRVSFVALDARGTALAQQTVTFNGPAPVLPTLLTLESPSGDRLDSGTVDLRVVVQTPGAAQQLMLRGGEDMAELARAQVGDRVWETTQTLPAPGEKIAFQVQALDRAGAVVAEDALDIERAPVSMQVQPTGVFEADTDSMMVQVQVNTGADWITAVVARDGEGGSVLDDGALAQGQTELKLEMPQPGETRSIAIAAMGRDEQAYASAELTLVRPAAIAPVALVITSPDGFAIDAERTSLEVHVANPADTAVIVVSDRASGQVLQRVRYEGEDWSGQVTMPAPGGNLPLVIEAQNLAGDTLARSQILLLRPVKPGFVFPSWGWIGALGLAAVGLGFLGAKFGGKRPVDPKIPPPRPRLYAQADQDPAVLLEPSHPPTIVLRIDEDETPEIEIEMEQESGASR